MRTLHDGSRQSQLTQAMQVRGPACCHAMQGLLRAVMADRQSMSPAANNTVDMQAKRRSSRSQRRRVAQTERAAFLTAHKEPKLYVLANDLACRALLELIKRSGYTGHFQVVEVAQAPRALTNILLPALVDQASITSGSDLFSLISSHKHRL